MTQVTKSVTSLAGLPPHEWDDDAHRLEIHTVADNLFRCIQQHNGRSGAVQVYMRQLARLIEAANVRKQQILQPPQPKGVR